MFQRMFSVAPPTIVEGRPESVVISLKWLLPKEEFLAKVATKDIEQRGWGPEFQAAVDSLTNLQDRVYRRINYDLLQRSLFMFYHSKKHKWLLPSTSFEDLTSRTIEIITSTAIDDEFLERHGLTDQELMNKGWMEFSTVRVLTHLGTNGNEGAVDNLLPDVAAYHLRVVSRMATHVQLNAANICRSTLLFGQMLSVEPATAQEAAAKLVGHLDRSREDRWAKCE